MDSRRLPCADLAVAAVISILYGGASLSRLSRGPGIRFSVVKTILLLSSKFSLAIEGS